MPRIYKSRSRVAIPHPRVSPEDEDLVEGWCWRMDRGYAIRGPYGKGKPCVSLHRAVLERMIGRKLEVDEVTDHINRDRLDNRRCNLRVATGAQNDANRGITPLNSSGYKGVSFKRATQRWESNIQVNGKWFYIGKYRDVLTAAWMRDQWALGINGEYAYLNFDYVEVPTQ